MGQTARRALRSPGPWVALVSLILAIVLALDLLPILRGGYDWEWPYRPMLVRYRFAPLLLGIIGYVAIGLWLRTRHATAAILLWSFAGGIGLSLAAVHLRGDLLYRLYSLTVSGRASGWHMAAAHIQELTAVLDDWPRFMRESKSFSPHIDHSPPGLVLIYYGAARILDGFPNLAAWMAKPLRWLLCQYLVGYTNGQYASAWIGILTPVWGSLTVFPLYYLGRRVVGLEATRWSILWWPLVPSFLIFTPLPYAAFALPSVAMIAVLWHGVWNDRAAYTLGAGALLSVMTFLNFVFIPLVLFAGLLTLGTYWLRIHGSATRRLHWTWPIRVGLWFGIGLSLMWLVFYAATGTGFWSIWQHSQETQSQVATVRPYVPFLAWNVNDFFMFTGWPVSLLAAVGMWCAVKNLATGKEASEGDVMLAAAGLTLLLIDLAGTPRGETGRLLLFMVPWMILAAASAVVRRLASGGLITIVQGIVAFVVIVCLHVLGPEFRARAAPAVPPSRLPAVRPPSEGVDALLDTSVHLLSVEGRVDSRTDSSGQVQPSLDLWMTWEDLEPVDTSYSYALALSDSVNGTPSPPVVIAPFSGAYPMTCWKPQDGAFTERIRIALPKGEVRPWWLTLSVIDTAGNPVGWRTSDGLRSTSLRLGPFLP